MTRAVGIDLGTTYTLVAAIENGRPKIIPNAEGQRLTPSVVAFAKQGQPVAGRLARRQAAVNPARTVFSIKRRMGSDYMLEIDQKKYTPQQISSLIMRKVKADAEHYLDETIEKAVVTVPAYFNDPQRQVTKEAGIMAGLDVIRIINEPTASALAYGLDREDIHSVLIWDLGGGTFDVSILELEKGIFEVRAVSGDNWLGGDDFDQRVMDYLAGQYREAHGFDFPEDGTARQRLKAAAEQAKIGLSSTRSVEVYVPLSGGSSGTAKPLKATLTRERLQDLTADLLQRMVGPTRQALADSELRPQDIDRVILVGGATRMPAVQELARDMIGKEPYRSIDPDEAVAMGAAIQAGMLLGQVEKAVLLDVLPLSLGVETQGGLFARIIRRNTPLPASEARIFTTAADNQTSVDIHVLQGERELAEDNVSLGQFQMEGIPPLVRGTPKIEVAFDVDVDGIVHVLARDLLTEKEQTVKVVSSKGLRPEETQRMIDEAESSAEEDRGKRAQLEAGIQADSAISAAEMLIEEIDSPDAYPQLGGIQRAVLRVKEAVASGNADDIVRRSGQLKDLLAAVHNGVGKTTPRSGCHR